jgi:hypothetical protein
MGLGLRIGLGLGFSTPSAGGGGGDVTAPTLSSPEGTQTGSTTATIGATTNEGNGTMYGVVSTSSTAPTATQVKAGQMHTGAAAAFAGSTSVASTGAKTISATGLTASTAYFAHLMHEDASGNKSSVSTSAQFTTAAGGVTTTLTTTNGTSKDPNITLTNGNLTANGTRNANDAVRATTKTLTSKFIVEFTLTFTSGTTKARCGIDAGTFDMSGGTSPGLDGASGVSMEVDTANSPNFAKDGVDQGFFGGPVASPLVVTWVVDTTTGTNNVLVYYTISGTTTLIKTLSYTPPSGNWFAWAGARNAGATTTVNFGATAFTYSPVGYSAYG